LVDKKIDTWKQVESGLARLRAEKTPFLPSPGEVVQACKGDLSDYGLPDLSVAYANASINSNRESENRDYLHPAVFLAAQDAKTFSGYRDPDKPDLFEIAYRKYCGLVMSGGSLVYPEDCRLPAPPKPVVDPAVAQASLRNLKNLIGGDA